MLASVIRRATAEIESSVVAKSTPIDLNWSPVDWMKLSGMIGVATNLTFVIRWAGTP